MSHETRLTPEQNKQLRARHPLYTRLSGDVVWAFFEEMGYGPDQCAQAMDSFIATMHEILVVMDRLEKHEADYFALQAQGPACPQCAPFMGKVFSTQRPSWQRSLPPFAVGCTMHCVALTETEMRNSGYELASCDASSASLTTMAPACPLLCPLLE